MHFCIAGLDSHQLYATQSPVQPHLGSTLRSPSWIGEEGPYSQDLLSLTDSNTLISELYISNGSIVSFDDIDNADHPGLYLKERSPPLPTFLSLTAVMDAQRYDLVQSRSHSPPSIEMDVSFPLHHVENDSAPSIISSVVFADPQPTDSLASVLVGRINDVREEQIKVEKDDIAEKIENSEIEGCIYSCIATPFTRTRNEQGEPDDVEICNPGCMGTYRSPDFTTDDCLPIFSSPVLNSSLFSLDRLNCLGSTDALNECHFNGIIDSLLAKKEKELAGEPGIRIWVTTTTEIHTEEAWRDPVQGILYGRFAGGQERVSTVTTTISRD